MNSRGCLVVVALAVIIGGIVFGYQWSRSTWIPPGHVGMLYSVSGGLKPTVYPPGRIAIPWFNQLHIYPAKTTAAVYSQDPQAGEEAGADGIPVTTNDNAVTIFDVIVFYCVQREDVPKLFKTFAGLPIEDVQRLHIRRAAAEAANLAGSTTDAFGLMGPHRREAEKVLLTELQRILTPKGITVRGAVFGACEANAALQAKMTERVNALTDLTIAEIDSQIAVKEKRIAVTRSRAEADAARLTATQAVGKSLEMLSLEVDGEAVDRWHGHLARYPGAHPWLTAAPEKSPPQFAAPVAQTEEDK